jgi:hypothetical protein
MKKQVFTMIAMIGLLGCLAASAKAQCDSMQSVVNIPFQYSAGQTMLPAGQYNLTCLDTEHRLLRIRSTDGKASAVIFMNSVTGKVQAHGKFVFHRYGSRYFFAQVWVSGSGAGLEMPKSRAERIVDRDLAGIKLKRETIAVSLRE